jgi:hypothetical protein
MPVRYRQKRLPISCEPCRIRKIRCSRPRGPSPCETCVRRNLASNCLYASHGATSPLGYPLQTSLQPPGSPTRTASSPDASLIARVAELEALLQAQGTNGESTSTTRPVSPQFQSKGALFVSDNGHMRFIPSSLSSSTSQPLSNPQQATIRSIDLSCGPYPLGGKPPNRSDLIADIPAHSHCNQLKNVFFESFASVGYKATKLMLLANSRQQLFHILHDPTFGEQYTQFERAPDSMPLSWLALMFAILGTAVTALDSSSWLLCDLSRKKTGAEKIAELSERYRNAAMKCLEADNYLWQHNVTTLQALIILVYGINHSHGQAWTLLGLTHHIALAIGCHIDPTEFDLDVIRSEERRRCWAGVMMLYMLQNTSLGHLGPDPRHSSRGVQLPADLNDKDLIADERVLRTTSGTATQMSYLLLKFRLYDISSDICSLVLNSLEPSSALIEKMDKAILDEQQSWNEKYLAHLTEAPLQTYHEAHLNILYGYAHHLTLLLHHHAMRNSQPDTLRYRRSASRCVDSAKELLRIQSVFLTHADFSPFKWYLRGVCSFHAFHAGVSLISTLASHSWNEEHSNLLALIQDCAAEFEILKEASTVCEKAAPILRQLL